MAQSSTNNSIKKLVYIALMTAILCVAGPFTIPLPLSPVPLSLFTLILYCMLYLVGTKFTTLSCMLYLLMGTIGIPVFSGFTGGIGRLVGPTGGYLLAYIPMILIAGSFLQRKTSKKQLQALGFIIATLVLYVVGTIQLSLVTNISFQSALLIGVLPYIPGDIIKILVAMSIGPILRKRLNRAGVLLF